MEQLIESTTYKDQSQLPVERDNGQTITIDVSDDFHLLYIIKSNITNLDTDKEIEQLVNNKITAQSLAIHKLSDLTRFNQEYYDFINLVVMTIYHSDEQISIQNLRSIFQNLLIDITGTPEEYFEEDAVNYPKLENQIIQSANENSLLRDVYFVEMFIALWRYQIKQKEFKENNPQESQLLERIETPQNTDENEVNILFGYNTPLNIELNEDELRNNPVFIINEITFEEFGEIYAPELHQFEIIEEYNDYIEDLYKTIQSVKKPVSLGELILMFYQHSENNIIDQEEKVDVINIPQEIQTFFTEKDNFLHKKFCRKLFEVHQKNI